MTDTSIANRLVGDSGRRLLIDLLKRQTLIEGSQAAAESVAKQCEIVSLPANAVLLRQGDADNDLYLILSGGVRILVNGREVACRGAGQHVGEMALVDAASKRTATIITIEPTALVRLSESVFCDIANANPFLWRNIAIELVKRLDERRKFHHSPNPLPFVFIGSSTEGLPFASALALAIPSDTARITLWSKGVFGASNFPIEDLSALLSSADFAVLLASADDMVVARGKMFHAPRDNIVFELGLFMGALSRQRTFLAVPQGVDIKIPSDLLGIKTVRYNHGAPTPDDAVHTAAEEIAVIIRNTGTR